MVKFWRPGISEANCLESENYYSWQWDGLLFGLMIKIGRKDADRSFIRDGLPPHEGEMRAEGEIP
jgi:hypothetical protein